MKYTPEYYVHSSIFRKVSKKESREFYDGFLESIGSNIILLKIDVNDDANFRSWEPSSQISSISAVGEWLASHIALRERTPEEIEAEENLPGMKINYQRKVFDLQTLRRINLVGTYLGEAIIELRPGLSWDLYLGNRRNINYGHPVITGFDGPNFNPSQIAYVFAAGQAYGGTNSNRSLGEIFCVWLNSK